MKDNILNLLLSSQTHYGQEARILTKYFIPDHKRILGIQHQIEYFRDYITVKKKNLQEHKSLVEDLIRREEELDNIFMEEIAKELEKQDEIKNNNNNN